MKDSIFATILAGVSVFVVGQFVLKLVLEPIVGFKESIGEVAAFCLRYRAKITNRRATLEMQEDLKCLIASMRAKRQAIPFYRLLRYVFALPSDKNLVAACQSMNLVSMEMVKETSRQNEDLPGCIEIMWEIQNVETCLNIRLDYSDS